MALTRRTPVPEAWNKTWKPRLWRRAPPPEPQQRRPARPQAKPTEVTHYVYHDEHDNPRYRVIRMSNKVFPQERYDADEQTWKDGKGCMNGVERLPYRLPELLAAPNKPVFIVEGEKDA